MFVKSKQKKPADDHRHFKTNKKSLLVADIYKRESHPVTFIYKRESHPDAFDIKTARVLPLTLDFLHKNSQAKPDSFNVDIVRISNETTVTGLLA
ncbi:MAG: hypothetical protein IKA42_04785, partial [Clostridia bacterium]|nr:hypothetical protein [Clostridia bacterium]